MIDIDKHLIAYHDGGNDYRYVFLKEEVEEIKQALEFYESALKNEDGYISDMCERKECNNGWIACRDRLPEAYDLHDYNIEDSASYLIQRRCGVMDVAHYIKIYGESHFSANNIEIKDVIAWQPLPQPYKGV